MAESKYERHERPAEAETAEQVKAAMYDNIGGGIWKVTFVELDPEVDEIPEDYEPFEFVGTNLYFTDETIGGYEAKTGEYVVMHLTDVTSWTTYPAPMEAAR